MTRSLLVAAVLLALAGCDEHYVQTRDAPKTVDEAAWDRRAFLRRGDDRTVGELPANPPALDDHRPYSCAKPGGAFLPPSMVAWEERPPRQPWREPVERMGVMDEAPTSVATRLRPQPEPPIGRGDGLALAHGAPETRVPVPTAAWDDRPESRTRGYATAPAERMAGWRDDELLWCDPVSR